MNLLIVPLKEELTIDSVAPILELVDAIEYIHFDKPVTIKNNN